MLYFQHDKQKIRQIARDAYGSDEVEVDPEAPISNAEGGFWVGAWVWVSEDADAS